MSHNFSLKYYQGRTLLILLIIIFGFISSKALISIGTGLLILNLLGSFKEHKFIFVKKSALPILSAILFFSAFVILFPFAQNYEHALHQIWTKLPWLIIPLSIAALNNPEANYIDFFVAFLVFIVSISGIIVLINYYSNYSYYTEQIALAKNIPTPLNHIRYSLLVAFAGIASCYYFLSNKPRISGYDQIFFGICSIFLFIFLHILSVRSGLIVYYGAAVYLMLYFAVQSKKWWLIPLVLLVLMAMPYFAYHNVKSFHNKVDYMMYDFEQMRKQDIGHNSDSRRLQSLQIGWSLLKEKPFLGNGVGNVDHATNLYYEEHHPEIEAENRKVPHNQFIFTTVEMGLIGLSFLALSLAIPILSVGLFRNPLYLSLAIMILLSCLVENTFESQVGMSFYLVFGSLLLKRNEDG